MLFNYALASLALTSCAYATPLKTFVTRQAAGATVDVQGTADTVLTPSAISNNLDTSDATIDGLIAGIGNLNVLLDLSDPKLNGLSNSDLANMRRTVQLGTAPEDGDICFADMLKRLLQNRTFQFGGCKEADWGKGLGCSNDPKTFMALMNNVVRPVRTPSQSGGLAAFDPTFGLRVLLATIVPELVGALDPELTSDAPAPGDAVFDPTSGLRVALATTVPELVGVLDPELTNDAPAPGDAPERSTGGGSGEGAGRGTGPGRNGEGAGRGSTPRPGNAPAPGGRGGNAAQRPRPNSQSVGSEQGYGSSADAASKSSSTNGAVQDIASPAAVTAANANGSASENSSVA